MKSDEIQGLMYFGYMHIYYIYVVCIFIIHVYVYVYGIKHLSKRSILIYSLNITIVDVGCQESFGGENGDKELPRTLRCWW